MLYPKLPSMASKTGVISVVVTYNSDLEVLGRLVDKCAPQVDAVVLVDNGDGVRLMDWQTQRTDTAVTILPLGENLGIAAAQNVGIEWARAQGAAYVLLFDHDSLPASDMAKHLLAVMREREASGEKIGIVGPRFVDSHMPEHFHPPHFVQLEGCRFRRAVCPPERIAPVLVDFLIASGSLIPLCVFDEVGLMNESLFIDHVDTEFSLRLKQTGYRCYGVPAAVMEHAIGDASRRIFGRNAPMHSPLRHYYIVRNATWIIRQPWMKAQWRIALGVNTFRRFIFYALFASPRQKHLAMMLRGFWHGLHGRMGQL